MKGQILRKREVCKLTGLSYSTIYRLERMDRFPARRKLGDWAVGWLLSEIEDWVKDRQLVEAA